MRINTNYWIAASGTLAVAGAIMLFSARRIEAQFSSPVKVLNTSSAPAISSLIDDPGRIPYDSSLFSSAGICIDNVVCNFVFGAVPANHRLVVQHVSGNATLTSGTSPFAMQLTNDSNSFLYSSFFTPPPTGIKTYFDVPVLAYFDATLQPTVLLFLDGDVLNGPSAAVITLSGYLLDCSAAPCAAIAH